MRKIAEERFVTRRRLLQAAAAVTGAVVSAAATGRLAWAAPQLLTARPGRASLLGASTQATPVWAYNDLIPGPILRARRGDELAVTLANRLEQPTTIHWHGLRLVNRMDGVPHLTQHAVGPGNSFEYRFTLPDAGTFWYHPHERSYEQVGRGLFGVLVVEEETPPAADQDLVLVISDWRLGSDGALVDNFGARHDQAHAGRLGNTITVNGHLEPAIPVRTNERVRLRILNASSARVLKLRLEGASTRLIALDGQPVGPTASYGGDLVLGPGNRADLMADMIGEPGTVLPLIEVSDKRRVLATLDFHESERARAEPMVAPIALAANHLLREPDLASPLSTEILMTGGAKDETDMATAMGTGPIWSFNGVSGMTENPLFSARRGQTVALRMINGTAWPHAMHIHGHHFRLIARKGGAKPEPFWWDTFLMQPREEVTVAWVADNPGKWMIHCHMLDHQAAGMDTWFEVQA